MNFICSAGENPNELLIQLLKFSRCKPTIRLISAKSAIRADTWLENSQISNTTIIVNNRIGKNMDIDSGMFNFLKKRNTGINIMLKKNAISKGIITMLPITIIVPSKNIPSNSIDRLTVTGSLFTYINNI
ncbi:hypothetical protein GCM10027049_22100 [Mucilaginibacter puniceus]